MHWTVDYGPGPIPCQIPHCWRQDVDVRWEGPAVYQTKLSVKKATSWLVFHGVSYCARVFINGELRCVHDGIWDAFVVQIDLDVPGVVEVRVEVTKNGGESYPVKDHLSGFLPYVFHTFGGIFREAELVYEEPCLDHGKVLPRLGVEGTNLFIDGKPWYMRGVLSWGWYPSIGSPHPSIEIVREEVQRVKALGFNLVKFCLWLPPHCYFQVLEEEDMWAWVELPLWLPSERMDLEEAFGECERIVRQYRHHGRIVAWTCGCELSHSTPHEFRKRLYQMVKELTGCPLVKDNSGGAEMYGGDLREYGDFSDFHPYCDTMFYPPVLESLRNGPRAPKPILLGEFNDYDAYRPISTRSGDGLLDTTPYWTSKDPSLNDQGVRWQYDLPTVLTDSTKRLSPEIEKLLVETSQSKAGWIREFVTMNVLQHGDIAGYVVTGLDDTPISTSGVYRDRRLRGLFEDLTFFRVPHRQPPWVNGGNRPAWADCHNVFPGANTIRIGARSTTGFNGPLEFRWGVEEQEWHQVDTELLPNIPAEIVSFTRTLSPGEQDLLAISGQYFDFACYARFDWNDHPAWSPRDPQGRLGKALSSDGPMTAVIDEVKVPPRGILFLDNVGTQSGPFWRECVQWNTTDIEELASWDFLYPISTDRVIDLSWLEEHLPRAEWLLTRVDTRTYERRPYLVRKENTVVTTLRPWGGLGAQPYGLESNPAGCELLRILIKLCAT